MNELDRVRPGMKIVGADGVSVGTVDHVEGDRLILTIEPCLQNRPAKRRFIPTTLVADVEGDKVRLSANAEVAVTLFEYDD